MARDKVRESFPDMSVADEERIFQEAGENVWEYLTLALELCTDEGLPSKPSEGQPDTFFDGQPDAALQEDGDMPSLVMCPKCGSKGSYTLKQTRSGDEAMTQFCKCKSCKYQWRQ